MKDFLKLKKKLFNEAIKNKEWIFIDIRTRDSFNGWKLNGEKYSGHIKRSINIPFINFKNDFEDMKKKSKEDLFSKINPIVICHSNLTELLSISNYLKINNYENLYTLDMRNLKHYHINSLCYYKNYKILVPPQFTLNNNFKVFHVGFGDEEKTSSKGHIKNSIYINTDELEPPPSWTMGSKETLIEVCKKYNISSTDKIIVTAWNQMASFRVAAILLYIGVKDVRVLNGGLSYYSALDFPLSTEKTNVMHNNNINIGIFNPKGMIVSTNKLKRLLKRKNFTLVDNRTWLEHIGKVSGYSYHKKRARIPGAVYGYAGYSGAQSLDYYRNVDGTMKSKASIKALWKQSNIKMTNNLTFMCGSGWRASEVYFYAKVLGYKNISVYSDGFITWSKDPNNPTITGIPK